MEVATFRARSSVLILRARLPLFWGLAQVDAIGKPMILFGATHDHARSLKEHISVPDSQDNETVAFECTVDVAASVAFRLLKLNNWRQITSVYPDRTCSPLDANGEDIPLEAFITNEALATMAAGSWQLLAENYCDDGWPATLLRAATQSFANATNYYFNNSTHLLEDALGLASAIAMGDLYGIGHGDEGKSELELHGGKFENNIMRIGSRDWTAWIYLVPPIVMIGAICRDMSWSNHKGDIGGLLRISGGYT
jgi:hypothetical protein